MPELVRQVYAAQNVPLVSHCTLSSPALGESLRLCTVLPRSLAPPRKRLRARPPSFPQRREGAAWRTPCPFFAASFWRANPRAPAFLLTQARPGPGLAAGYPPPHPQTWPCSRISSAARWPLPLPVSQAGASERARLRVRVERRKGIAPSCLVLCAVLPLLSPFRCCAAVGGCGCDGCAAAFYLKSRGGECGRFGEKRRRPALPPSFSLALSLSLAPPLSLSLALSATRHTLCISPAQRTVLWSVVCGEI